MILSVMCASEEIQAIRGWDMNQHCSAERKFTS